MVGQAIPMVGGTHYVVDGAREYLRTGFLKAYEAKYATFAARAPGGCTTDLPARKAFNTTLSSIEIGAVYWVGSEYVAIGNQQGGSQQEARRSADLTTWTTVATTSGVASTGTKGLTFMGGSVNRVLRSQWSGGADGAIWTLAAGGNWTVATGAPAGNGNSAGAVESNAAGTLAVLLNNAAGNLAGTAGHIYTSTTGTTWTSRTPSGVPANTWIAGVHWSPAAAAFLYFGNNSTLGIVAKSTDGFTLSSSYAGSAAAGAFAAAAPATPQNYAASSPTVTLLSLAGYQLLRTTDGTNWTVVDLKAQSGLSALLTSTTTAAFISYDTVNTRFVAGLATTSGRTTLAVSTDGITWTALPVIRQLETTPDTLALRVFSANGKTFMLGINTLHDCAANLGQAAPDWVGGAAVTFATDIPAYARIA